MKTAVTGSGHYTKFCLVYSEKNLSAGKAISNVNDFFDLRNLQDSFENIY